MRSYKQWILKIISNQINNNKKNKKKEADFID
jgi:hypothetical protein